MGREEGVRTFRSVRRRRRLPELSDRVRSRRRRAYFEWATLRSWGQAPPWETDPPGYVLRLAREEAGLTQQELGRRLGVSQQAVARAEGWDANPTISFIDRWATACGRVARLDLGPPPR